MNRAFTFCRTILLNWGEKLGSEVEAMTAADFRRIALTMPEAVEGSHFGNADFLARGFANLSLPLPAEKQAGAESKPSAMLCG